MKTRAANIAPRQTEPVHEVEATSPPPTGGIIATSSAVAAALLFFLSGSVLIIEILAARLLAPVVGLSLETYTAIIGVVLAGIAVGHAAGGAFADRPTWRQTLGWCVLVGGVLAGFTVPIVSAIATSPGDDAVAATIVITVAAFFLPTAVLSAASPIIISARVRELATVGHVFGWLSAASTAGALAGTFLAGFVLVGWAPTSRALFGLAGLLVVLGTALAVTGRAARLAVTGALALVVPLSITAPIPCPIETEYYCVSISVARDDPSARVMKLDRLIQGYSDLDDPERLGFRFQRVIALAIEVVRPGRPLAALHIGGGAFAMPRYLAAARPGTTSRVLEIDPRLDDIAARFLGLDPSTIEIVNGDGRALLRRERSNTYDVVVTDVLGSLDPPWHLTTVEVAETVRRVLAPGGVYIVNAVDTRSLRFARSEAATLQQVFNNVTIVAPPPEQPGDASERRAHRHRRRTPPAARRCRRW